MSLKSALAAAARSVDGFRLDARQTLLLAEDRHNPFDYPGDMTKGTGQSVLGGGGGGAGPAIQTGRYSQSQAHHADQYGYFAGYPYAIISNIANRLAAQPIKVGRIAARKGKVRPGRAIPRAKSFDALGSDGWLCPKHLQEVADRVEVIPNHRINRAISNPNPIMVRHHLLFSTFASIEITGVAYWWMFKDEETGRGQIWPIPTHWMEPVHEEGRLFSYYHLMLPGSGTRIKVPTRQVARFMMADPSDPFGAYPTMQAMAKTVMTDWAFEVAQRMSLENGINPGLAIMVGKPPEFAGLSGGDSVVLTKDQRDQITQAVKRKWGGVTRFDEPMILDALIRDVKQITTSPREMAFKESGPLVRNRLSQGWSMNPITLGEIEGVNYASSGVADHHVCFVPGTGVITSAGVRPIEEVVAGDEVMSHTGRWRTVTGVMERVYSGRLVNATVKGCAVDVRMTPDHPVRVEPGEWVPAAASDGEIATLTVPAGGRDVLTVSGWVANLTGENGPRKRSDGLRVKLRRNGVRASLPAEFAVSPEMAYFFGLYLAEGHVDRNNGVQWSLHAKEAGYADRIQVAFGGLARCDVKTHRRAAAPNSVQLSLRNATFAALVVSLFGQGSRHKRVPAPVFGWSATLRDQFLRGYLAGDGHVADDAVTYSSVSRSIAYGVRLLARSLGLNAQVFEFRQEATTEIQERLVNQSPVRYHGRFYAESRRRLTGEEAKHHHADKPPRIAHADQEEYDGPVYNLSVEEDESYTLENGWAVHNCRTVFTPRVEVNSQTLTKFVGPYFGGQPVDDEYDTGDLVVYQEPVRPSDPEMDQKMAEADMDRAVRSRNDIRRERGLEPLKYGGWNWIGGSWVCVDGDPDDPPPAPEGGGDAGGGGGGGFGNDDGGRDDDDQDQDDEEKKPVGVKRRGRSRRRKKGKGTGAKNTTDDEGHEHDGSTGQFTSGGGGGSADDEDDDAGTDDHDDDGPDHSATHDKWDAEDKELRDRQEREQRELDGRHAQERREHEAAVAAASAELQAPRKAEDKALADARAKEDRATQAARDKEDRDIQAGRDKEDKATEKKREKEDERLEKKREKEEEKHDEKWREKEDEVDKGDIEMRLQEKWEKEDEKRDAKREKEDEKRAERQEKERDEYGEKWQADRDAIEARHGEEHDALADKHQAEQEELDRKLQAGEVTADAHGEQQAEMEDRHQEEQEALDEQHEAELEEHDELEGGDDLDEKHQEEDEEVEKRREEEDAATEEARSTAVDDTYWAEVDAVRGARDAAEEKMKAKWAEEDKERDAGREQEDADRAAAREQEDDALNDKRGDEDADREAARAAHDAEVEARREAEDDTFNEEWEAKQEALDERHAAEQEEVSDRHQAEQEEHEERQEKEDPEAWAARSSVVARWKRLPSPWLLDVSPDRRRTAQAVDRLSGEAQERIRGVLLPVLEAVGQRAAAQVRDALAGGRPVSPSELAHTVVDRHRWEHALAEGLREAVALAANTGAAAEWEAYREFRAGKGHRVRVKMPNRFWQAVRDIARDLSSRTTVRGIIESVVQGVRKACRKAQAQGKTGSELADAVNAAALVGPGAAKTANAVARNEGAGAVNAGQDAVRGELAKLGRVSGCQWVCVDDRRTRPTHRQADGQTVTPGRAFTVGGFQCKRPGDPALPAKERDGCRCRVVTIFK